MRNRKNTANGGPWRRWHRVLGLVSAVFVVLLSVTGLVLNHTERLRLDEIHLSGDWLLALYGIEPAGDVVSYRAGNSWVSSLDGRLFLDAEPLEWRADRLQGAVVVGPVIAVALDAEVALLTRDGRLVERLGATAGVPATVTRIGATPDGRLVLRDESGHHVSDEAMTRFAAGGPNAPVVWSEPAPLPEELRRQVEKAWRGEGLSLERVMLDLHSGRVLGVLGVLLVDAMALIFLFLAGSGIWLWWQRRQMTRAQQARLRGKFN